MSGTTMRMQSVEHDQSTVRGAMDSHLRLDIRHMFSGNINKVCLVIGLLLTGLTYHAVAEEIWSGEMLYRNSACSGCHGAEGEGRVPLNAPKIAGLDAWYLERQMYNFKAGIRGDHPQDLDGRRMILFARVLQVEGDIEKLSAYIAALPDMPASQTIEGDINRGGEIYTKCVACHGQRGEGVQNRGGPRLAGIDDWYLASQLRKFRDGALGYSDKDRFGKKKRAAMEKLAIDDAAIMDVVAYINFFDIYDTASKPELSTRD